MDVTEAAFLQGGLWYKPDANNNEVNLWTRLGRWEELLPIVEQGWAAARGDHQCYHQNYHPKYHKTWEDAADVNDDRIAVANLVQARDVEDAEDRGN